ncbi:putative mitochondrial intermembrane space translocase subunit Tim13 [Aspergillus steynii IBT 23096]|uniref:Mitochondrial import inner membrane translocase subunit n=1 Tax=Aspergillus steynii IBT 23096 TaxID=1392250 RepID=A0A2I2G4L7_9EURO|nr:putative mitochondrial intermembrane space translocase subunit Tim13 [Aspergillus steynii IBT 23096]PLB47825.1 putative mitochondrial intermembrane space translocase subunit Tim13 [Aspergillus steynii IBT 23096]
MSFFGSGSGNASPNPQETKTLIMKQLQQEAAMNNARTLIAKVNEHCFESCIPRPGSSLSSSEGTCLSNCMEKYISMWNVASRSYVSRIAVESKKAGGAQEVLNMNALASSSNDSL